MVAFINTFLSYLLVMIVFLILIVAAVILGKKLRENKDAKLAMEAANADTSESKDE